MNPTRRLRFRILSLLLLALSVAGVAAGIAFARSSVSPKPVSPNAGIVIIETALGYQQAAAAGTGMVLTPNGEVLTNNHVIKGATQIKVRIPSTGRSYSASVLGYSVSADAALLKLANATKLATVTLGRSAKLKLGQLVHAVGNANGVGHLITVRGKIVGLGKSITVSDDQGGSESLSALIQTDAALQPGDSGGPLMDSTNRVIGMDTAASVSGDFYFRQTNAGFAIPIDRAMVIVKQIEAGKASATVHIDGTAFLGIDAAQSSDGFGSAANGVVINQIVPGSPADGAGLAAGDEITAIDGKSITSSTALVAYLLTKHPGDKVTLTILDGFGQQQTVGVTLGSGPPQ